MNEVAVEVTYLKGCKIYLATVEHKLENRQVHTEEEAISYLYWKERCEESEKVLRTLVKRSKEIVERATNFLYNTEANSDFDELIQIPRKFSEARPTSNDVSSNSDPTVIVLPTTSELSKTKSTPTIDTKRTIRRRSGGQSVTRSKSSLFRKMSLDNPSPSVTPPTPEKYKILNKTNLENKALIEKRKESIQKRAVSGDFSIHKTTEFAQPVNHSNTSSKRSHQRQKSNVTAEFLKKNHSDDEVPILVPPLSYTPVLMNEFVPPVFDLSNEPNGYVIEPEVSKFNPASYKLNVTRNIYLEDYVTSIHYNWIARTRSDTPDEEYFFISVLETPTPDGKYKVLKNSKEGFETFLISLDSNEQERKVKSQLKRGLILLFPDVEIISIKDSEAPQHILGIEKKHRQVVKEMTISVIYCKPDQVNPHDMLKNEETSPAYRSFLRLLGVPRDYEPYNSNHSFWRGIDVQWYIADKLNEEEQRRFIGNSLVVMIFKESGQINASMFHSMGSVNQFFLGVQHIEGNFKLGFLRRNHLGTFGPEVQSNSIFDMVSLKDFILTKIHNSLVEIRRSPPLSRMYETPRHQTLMEVAKKLLPKKLAI
eukprot:TRINITY_DN4399_c0_g1_i3.p1 TRINITY_DN4399_c0_g1~~TRINITY_DN4399_c0_g1_i3.p1  ORF type:complete len:594 (+),score=63.47 TRINITY_DN4399_c0_g1_i3:20-1801(+)